MLDDITRNRHKGNAESEEANTKIHPTKEATRLAIYGYAATQKEDGVLADEVAEAFHCTHNHVAPRISELKREGRLVPIGKRRRTRAGSWARVLVTDRVYEAMQPKPKGQAELFP